MRQTIAVLILFSIVLSSPALGQEGLAYNATIYTMAEDADPAEAMAWDREGRILALGDSEGLQERFSDKPRHDLQGRVIIPGLIDAHGHIMNLGLSRLQADLGGTESVEEVIEVLREHEKTLPDEAWLTGRGWDQTRWPEAEFPLASDLDEAFPDRPVWLVRVDGHAAWANQAAMDRADKDLSGDWQPRGGQIFRDGDQQPTGIFIDTAMGEISSAIPETSEAEREHALDLALEEIARMGLTGVHEAGTSQDDLRRYLHREATDGLTVRIFGYADGDGAMLASLCRNGKVETRRIAVRGVKLYTDGALGSRGAALLEDYADDPGNTGLLFESDEDLQEVVDRAMECGLQLAIHAIGDAANRQAIDVIAAGRERIADNPGRHRIEHVQIIDPEDIPRLAEAEIVASMQPVHATSDMRWAEDRLGPDRLEGAYAWQRILDAGAVLALGSDFPVEPVNPMYGIHAAVTRQDRDGNPEGGWLPGQRLSIEQALAGFTRDAAYAGFAEEYTGTLEPGKLADFVVLDTDPFEADPETLHEIEVLMTVVGGETVFERD